MNLYIDIETIPTQLIWVKEKIKSNIKAPGNYKIQESIDTWMAENADAEAAKKIEKTSFNGSVGEIISVSAAVDDGAIKNFGRKLGESETDMLNCLFDFIDCAQYSESKKVAFEPVWVGHCIAEFDLKFLWQRSIVSKCNEKGVIIPKNSKPWSKEIFDTCYEWSGSKSPGFGSLDDLCKIFGIEGKGELDGSKIWEYVQAGRYDEIYEYNNQDVEKARILHKIMRGIK